MALWEALPAHLHASGSRSWSENEVINMIPILLFLVFIFLLSLRARQRDQAECARWWHDYRERERITDLQHAWRAGLRQRPDETEDEFVERFKDWLYARDLRDDDDVREL